MSTSGGIHASIILLLITMGFYISPDSATAEEPAEDVIQELIRSDARAASAANLRAPLLGICKVQESNESGQLPAPDVNGSLSGGTVVAPRGDYSGLSLVAGLSSYCKLYDLLARGEICWHAEILRCRRLAV
jgi:hypothetical protein